MPPVRTDGVAFRRAATERSCGLHPTPCAWSFRSSARPSVNSRQISGNTMNDETLSAILSRRVAKTAASSWQPKTQGARHTKPLSFPARRRRRVESSVGKLEQAVAKLPAACATPEDWSCTGGFCAASKPLGRLRRRRPGLHGITRCTAARGRRVPRSGPCRAQSPWARSGRRCRRPDGGPPGRCRYPVRGQSGIRPGRPSWPARA